MEVLAAAVLVFFSKSEQQGTYSSQGASDIFALYQVIGYTKTPGTITLASTYSANVSNQNNDGLHSSSVTFTPYNAPAISADLPGAGNTSNAGSGGSSEVINVGCGTQGTYPFSAYPGVLYYPFFSSGTFGAGTLYGSLAGVGIAEGTVSFSPQLGTDDPEALIDGPLVAGQSTTNPPMGSTVDFSSLSYDPDNGGTTPQSGICSTVWRVTTESGVATYTTPQISFTALPGFYLVELEVTDNEGATTSSTTAFSVGSQRNLRPGYDSPSCGGDGEFGASVDPSSGNLSLMYSDPVRTRGYPLKNNIHINSQTSFPNYVGPLGNASFSYGIRVTQGFIPNDPTSHWMVVDGDGRELDFGPTTSSPTPGPSVFSTLIYNPLTGFTLTNAGAPESIEKFGNYIYTFDVNGRLTELEDPAGNTQVISYNTSLKPTQVLDVNTNKTITFGYNTSGLIDTITENSGGAVTHLTYLGMLLNSITLKDNTGTTIRSAVIDYDDFNLPSKLTKDGDPDTALTFTNFKMAYGVFASNITDTQGGNTSFVYSTIPPSGVTYRTSQTNVNGGTTYYDFDSKGDLISVTMPPIIGATQPVKYNYTYNVHHDLTSVTDGATTYTLTYTPEGLLDTVTNNLSEFRNYDYQGADLTKITDNYGTVLEIGYTNTLLPHIPTTFKDGANNLWTRSVNQFGQTVGISPPAGSPLGATKFTYFEKPTSPSFGYLSSVTNGAGDRVRINGYSPLGDILSITTDWSLGSSSGITGGGSGGGGFGTGTIGSSTSVSVSGSTHASLRATFNTYSFVYDAAQRLTGVVTPDLKTIDYNYTGKDLTSIVDEGNTTTTYEYCPSCDKLTAVHAALGKNLSWTLDGDKNVTTFTDPRNNNTIYDIGTGNELKKTRYPLNFDESYTYDNQGRLKTISKTGINPGTLNYDGDGRLSSIDYPGTNPSDSSYQYRLDGLIEIVTDDIGTATYTYTPNRLVESVTYNYSPHLLMQHQRIEYTYNPDGSRATMTWKNGGIGGAVVASWSYSYDKAGRLSKVENNFSDSVTYTYDRESKLTKEKRGNGTATDYSYYQPRGWPTKITHKLGLSTFASYALEYDSNTNTVGNITKVTELDTSVVNYTYDALYRLTGDVRTGTNPYTHSYGYDLSGNVTHLDGSLFATYNAANEADSISLPGGVVQNFDARVHEYKWNGIVGGNFLFEDDFTIRLRSFGGGNEENFRTDGHGRRVLTWLPPNNNHVFYIYDGDELIGEISRDGTPQMAYTWGNGLASLRNIQTSQSRYYHFGPQGETRYLTNSTGTVTDTYNFTAYGVPVASTGTTYNPHQYGGKYGYYKRGIGQQLLVGHRWYSPYLMRWLTHDPIGYQGGTNLYEYVGGNPVRYVDPDGLAPGDIYPDADSAAMAALTDILPTSIQKNIEHAGRVYRLPDGSHSYTPPRAGDRHSSQPGRCPNGTFNAGSYHTHGAKERSWIPFFSLYEDEEFSPIDREFADSEKRPIYLGTPSGKIKKYTPGRESGLTGSTNTIGVINP